MVDTSCIVHRKAMFFVHVCTMFPHADIDECKELKIDCGTDKTCFNRRGDFVCLDTPCPEKYKRDPSTGYVYVYTCRC